MLLIFCKFIKIDYRNQPPKVLIKDKMTEKIKNIGIFAHADAGKTSLLEQFLYQSGSKSDLGSVDKGTSSSDTEPLEIERGISIHLSTNSFHYKEHTFNIIDTPGHVDFSSEVEYALKAIDLAILIISAVEGLQSQSLSILHALENMEIPVLIFINKIDRAGTQIDTILQDLETESVRSQLVLTKLSDDTEISYSNLVSQGEVSDTEIEILSENDDEILEAYLKEETIDIEKISSSLIKQIKNKKLNPVILGSAKLGLNIHTLLDAIIDYFKIPEVPKNNTNLDAIVFKISEDKHMGRLAYVRVRAGKVETKKGLWVSRLNKELKPSRIEKIEPQEKRIVSDLLAGEIGIIAGLENIQTGDILGNVEENNKTQLDSPLMTVQVKALDKGKYSELATALGQLNAGNPLLNFTWLKEEQEFHLDLMGQMQTEILEDQLQRKFNLEVEFLKPQIKYKETPSKTAEGYVCYWMPKPCWAIIKFLIEPAEQGSGVSFKSKVPLNDVSQKYQNEVSRTIPKALEQGIKGWGVTDLKITMIEGEEHNIHTRPSDFVIATPMGIMDALKKSDTTLLEPILNFKIQAEESLLGEIISDITKMRGEIDSPKIKNGKFELTGNFPLATSMDYSLKFNSKTAGKGKIITHLSAYKTCQDEQGIIREYKGISPLDTAKYILKARKAITESYK